MEGPGPQTVREHLVGLAILSSIYWIVGIPLLILVPEFTFIYLVGGYLFFIAGFVVLLSIVSLLNLVVFGPILWLVSRVIGDKTEPNETI